MNKLYFYLHNENNNFKKQFLRISLLLFFIVYTGTKANAQCDVNAVANQTVCNNTATTPINFTGTATTFNWVNNTTSIGLAASGTGNIASFTALNTSAVAVTATIIVTPSTGACTGAPVSFTITVNPSPVVNVTPTISCGGYPTGQGCNPLTASGTADIYIWSPFAGLYTDCTATAPYTGTNTPLVYASPTSSTVYTVTGTFLATGCVKAATALVNATPPAPVIIPPSVYMCLGDPAVKLRVAAGTGSTQFCSGTVNIPVPDNNPAGAFSSINVSGIYVSCLINWMTVTINMSHTRIGNMVFVLKAPNGQVINLDYYITASGGNGPSTGFTNTVFSSIGTTALSAGANPYTGTFRADIINAGGLGAAGPTGMLPNVPSWSNLFSTPGSVTGSWTLGFYDGVTGDVGTLNSWCLGFNYTCQSLPATPATWSPIIGLFTDPFGVIPYVGNAVDSVWVRPIPAGVYPYQVTTQGLPGPPLGFSNPAAITIPVGGAANAYPSDVTVSGLPTGGVTVRNVVLNGFNHTKSEDIDIILQSPSGQNVILMSDVGGANAANATYTFIDAGPVMSFVAANPSGTYKPSNNGVPDNFLAPGPGNVSQPVPAISQFTGNLNGTWKLFVMDDDGSAGQGIISSGYTINFDIGAPACTSPPRSVVVTVGNAANIVTQPVDKTVCNNSSVSFNAGVAGTGPFTFQWQTSTNGGLTYANIVNAGVFSGVNTATLTINPVALIMNGNLFRLLVNGGSGCPGATSSAALLTVYASPTVVITANPLIIAPGQTTTIFSTVTPSPAATYTWYYNGLVIPGATADTLLVNYGSAGDYELQVTDVYGCGLGISNIIFIANSFALDMLSYPNPSRGVFQVRYKSELNTTEQRTLNVFNNRGDRVVTKTFNQSIPYQKIDVDVRANGKGIYWIELRDANGKRLGIDRVVVQ